MNFQDIPAFITFYNNQDPSIVLIISDGCDNKIFFTTYLAKDDEDIHYYDADTLHASEFYGHVENYGFFSNRKTIVINKLEAAKSSLAKAIQEYCIHSSKQVRLVLYSSNKKEDHSPLATSILQKGGGILRLTAEKIYVKENRIIKKLQEIAAAKNKSMTSSVLRLMIGMLGSTDFYLLTNELFKLIAYTGESSVISYKDVKDVVANSIKTTFWKINNFIFKDDRASLLEALGMLSSHDLSDALGLVVFLRNRMSEALVYFETGTVPEKDARYMEAAKKYGINRIKMALIKLFEAEQALKSQGANARFILELLSMRLTHYATSSS
ncbi:DNA polymerase III subunit delta [Candidatus Clavichlamydia salmonicola]|uniref:DNA polymerase III subunit delta n=1 Tax=Candidatus Clavichlamydia salmonicola TaxID=469812 RepID=UPI0018914AB2|nr:hypothetical protein [Candidatus Clavichlamydia salmonicola]